MQGRGWVPTTPKNKEATTAFVGQTSVRGSTLNGSSQSSTAPIFGSSLAALLARDGRKWPWLKVPRFVYKSIKFLTKRGLEQAGLFKQAGSGPEVARYQEMLDNGHDIDFKEVDDVNTVTSLLKTFLRQLPEPLLTAALYDEWTDLPGLADPVTSVQRINELVHQLPIVNQAVLAELMKLLYQIDQASPICKMDAGTLSALLGKVLLWKDEDDALEAQVKLNDALKLMILEYPLLFESEEAERASLKPEAAAYARFVRKLVGHKRSVTCMETTPDGRHMWSGDSEGVIRMWAVDELRFVREVEVATGRFFSIKRVPNPTAHNGYQMWCATEKSLQIRDGEASLLHESQFGTFCILPLPQGQLWTGHDGKIRVWDSKRLECKREIVVPAAVIALAVHGHNIWGACIDKKLRVWDIRSCVMIKEMSEHGRRVNDVVTVGDTVWSSSDDKIICIWDAHRQTLAGKIKTHTGFVYGLTFMGDTVWSCSWDKRIGVWDRGGNQLAMLRGYHNDAVSAVHAIYSPRRRAWLAFSASYDRTLCVWLLTPRACPFPPPRLEAPDAPRNMTGTLSGGVSMSLAGTLSPATISMAASLARTGNMSGAVDTRSDPAGLSRWEFEPSAIKNPGNSLGTGSFGTVFKAQLHGKDVAVKKLSTQKFDEKTLDEFRKEVAIMSTLRHPNVLLFMGACTQPGNLLIVTELMPRGSVYDLLRDSKVTLSFKRKMLIAKDAALGVNWLHRSKPQFLHLDLKAANLLVDKNWTVKVADFGLSVVKKEAAATKEKHGPIGTPLWMAPEVLMNKEYDEKADVYSFGIVLWEILTGQDPWQDIESLVDLVEAVCLEHRRPPLPRDIPIPLRDLINQCWHPTTESRPPFEALVPRFDAIVVEGILGQDPMGRTLWSEQFLPSLAVPWTDFVRTFSEVAKLPPPTGPTDIKYQCLRTVLSSPKDPERVTIEAFSKMLAWFGPLAEPGILDRIYELLKKPYFHGEISSVDAEKLVAGEKKRHLLAPLFQP
eukprot:TRINITY_DN7230_c0_g1_i2.p1 TRINITY_DN7230_c0_g1~~TRINITY_DN7230_c0_g1_i2.p1  ORF type:complete len:1005 (-),score=128.15 TRINITY_DN7230_c0_g1_i2:404-3418(-)